MERLNEIKPMPFREFAINWRQQMKINSNEAARFFNMNPSSEFHGLGTGRANREMILFRANRIAVQQGKKKPFSPADADKNFVDFTEEQRVFIIHALNEISHFGRNLPGFISIADCRLNL